MLVSSLIHEITLKTVVLYKKTVLRENMKIDKFSYTDVMNMNTQTVVTPSSIYCIASLLCVWLIILRILSILGTMLEDYVW